MERPRVVIIIPAYNEYATIATVVIASKVYGDVIVIDDFSTDETALRASAAGALVVRHTYNKGYDGALNSGFNEATRLKYDFIITLDADGQHDPSLIDKYVNMYVNGIPLVLGVRNSKARFAEYLFGFYTKIKYGILDPLCGMKGYDRRIFEMMGHFDSYGSIGTELMLNAVSKRYRFSQVTFKVKKRVDSPRFGRLLISEIRILRAMFLWILFKSRL